MFHIFRLIPLIAISTLGACSPSSPTQHDARYLSPDYTNAPKDLSTPQSTAYSMMIAMYHGDADMVDTIFHETGRLIRVKADGSVEPDGLKRWRDWVGTLETGQAYEDIFGLEVQEFGNLATVWAPFVIRFDGKLVGCGVNQLSMVKQNNEWRISFGIDTPAPKESCETFKGDYLARHGAE